MLSAHAGIADGTGSMPEFSQEATSCFRCQSSPYALRVNSARLNWIWFHPSSSRMGIVQMNGFTRVALCTEQQPVRNDARGLLSGIKGVCMHS